MGSIARSEAFVLISTSRTLLLSCCPLKAKISHEKIYNTGEVTLQLLFLSLISFFWHSFWQVLFPTIWYPWTPSNSTSSKCARKEGFGLIDSDFGIAKPLFICHLHFKSYFLLWNKFVSLVKCTLGGRWRDEVLYQGHLPLPSRLCHVEILCFRQLSSK